MLSLVFINIGIINNNGIIKFCDINMILFFQNSEISGKKINNDVLKIAITEPANLAIV